jgi:hypothetical protein
LVMWFAYSGSGNVGNLDRYVQFFLGLFLVIPRLPGAENQICMFN